MSGTEGYGFRKHKLRNNETKLYAHVLTNCYGYGVGRETRAVCSVENGTEPNLLGRSSTVGRGCWRVVRGRDTGTSGDDAVRRERRLGARRGV